MQVGVVEELWRYPVKSMRGERIRHAVVHHHLGISGDRGWAVCDESIGEVRSAKRLSSLLQCAARYLDEPEGATTPPVLLTLPDGRAVRSDDPAVHDVLSGALGRQVTLQPRAWAADAEHLRRRESIDVDEMRRQYGLDAADPLPPPSTGAPRRSDLRTYVAPIGTFFDADELHLLSTSTLDHLRRRHPDAGVDVRRYRPNLVLRTPGGHTALGEPEFSWVGRRLRIGEVELDVARRTQRCVMVTHVQDDLAVDRSVLRTLVRETAHTLGVAADVVRAGVVRVGDPVELH